MEDNKTPEEPLELTEVELLELNSPIKVYQCKPDNLCIWIYAQLGSQFRIDICDWDKAFTFEGVEYPDILQTL